MKARFVRDTLYEFERSSDPDIVKSTLGIGNPRNRAESVLKKWAEENEYGFKINRNGNFVITGYYDRGDGTKSGKSFSVTFPEGREQSANPISLRNNSGQLMDRFPNAAAVKKRIEGNLEREAKTRVRETRPGEVLLDALGLDDMKKVQTLLDQGVKPNHSVKTKIEKNIPLFVAAGRENFEAVEALVNAGADINATTKRGRHVITDIIYDTRFSDRKKEQIKILKFLLANGGDPSGDPNISGAVGNAPIEVLKLMMKHIEIPEEDLVDMLGTAAWMGQYQKLKFLLELGVDPYDDRASAGGTVNTFKAAETASERGTMSGRGRWRDNYQYGKVMKELEKYKK